MYFSLLFCLSVSIKWIGSEDCLQNDLDCVVWGVKLFSNPAVSSVRFLHRGWKFRVTYNCLYWRNLFGICRCKLDTSGDKKLMIHKIFVYSIVYR